MIDSASTEGVRVHTSADAEVARKKAERASFSPQSLLVFEDSRRVVTE